MITLNSMLTSKGSQNTWVATHHVAVTEKFMLTCCYRPGCHHHCTRRADQYHHPHGTMEDLLLCNFLFQKWISTQTMGRYVGATHRCHSCSDTCYGHYMATIWPLYSWASGLLFCPLAFWRKNSMPRVTTVRVSSKRLYKWHCCP